MTLQRILTKVFISNIENSTAIQVPGNLSMNPRGSRTAGWEPRGRRSWFCFWRLLRHTVFSCVTEPFGFELLTVPSVTTLFFDW